jgi:predicted phage terminase large subunit-like protein
VTWPNGAIATLFSAEEPNRLRGPNHDFIWCDELASWANAVETWDMAMFTLRLGKRPRCVVTTTPKPTKLVRSLLARVGQDVVCTGGPTSENAANLAPAFLDSINRKYAGTRLGRQELEAELLEDVEGALWNLNLIDELRRSKNQVPEFKRVVVAIDPAISCGEDSDETGILVAGLGTDGHGYVLEDASGKYLPNEWARKAVGLYHKYSAHRIVAEINQGGQMVEQTIRAVDANIPFRGVHAKRGKLLRAEPISALYEQGRVHHVGAFPELEDQMTTYAGGGESPDRLDAAVYALTELLSAKQTTGIIDYYRELVEADKAGAGLPPKPAPGLPVVRMIAPEGISNVMTLSGRCMNVGVERIVQVSDKDAVPLRQAGFADVEAR